MDSENDEFGKMVAKMAIAEGLDPLDIALNGLPLEFVERVNKAMADSLQHAKDAGKISDYIMVAQKVGPEMRVSVSCVPVGHIEKMECEMTVGTIEEHQ